MADSCSGLVARKCAKCLKQNAKRKIWCKRKLFNKTECSYQRGETLKSGSWTITCPVWCQHPSDYSWTSFYLASSGKLLFSRKFQWGLVDLVRAVNWKLEFQLKALVSSVLLGSKTIVVYFCERFKGSSSPYPCNQHSSSIQGQFHKWFVQGCGTWYG